ncbi:MAG: 8-oxo-dGTP diphosphatase MutT [Limisphaerales bacterium]
MNNPVVVAAGLLFQSGKLLITQRPLGGHLAGLWEFPGGKCEPGETLPECLQRELHEELGVVVNVRECVETLEHAYPEKTVQLSFYRCALVIGEPEGREGQSIKWVGLDELGQYQFPEADAQLLEKLKANPDWWGE